jgi:hypothetical protein
LRGSEEFLRGNERIAKIKDRMDMGRIEEKLLAALTAEAEEMKPADWDQMRERVRRTASQSESPARRPSTRPDLDRIFGHEDR